MQRRWIIAVALCLPSIVGLSSNCGSVADHGPQHGERLDARGGHGVPRRDGYLSSDSNDRSLHSEHFHHFIPQMVDDLYGNPT